MRFVLSICIVFFLSTCKQKEKTEKPDTITACILSEITYCNHPKDSLTKYLPGWTIVWNPTDRDVNYAFVATDGINYALAIRGSLFQFTWSAFNNWMYQNLNVAIQSKWKYTDSTSAKISRGSYEGWQNISNMKDSLTGKSLWQFLDSAVSANTSITITGHSLGGSLATVYASWLEWTFKSNNHLYKNIDVITFAAPAAGNAAFAGDFNARFPNAMRFENINDIVPKLPVVNKVNELGTLYNPFPSASKVDVGYKFLTIKLSAAFNLASLALSGLEIKNGNSIYTQPNGKLIKINLSGRNMNNEAADWFAEAGYQHSIEQYAANLGAPVIICR